MGQHQIVSGKRGVYEITTTPGDPATVTIAAGPTLAQVIHHTGDAPIYVAVNNDNADPGDPAARMITPGSWMDVPLDTARTNTLRITTRADAVISVALPS